MQTIKTLIDGLRRYGGEWRFRQLPGGSQNPLVISRVLVPSDRAADFVDCPDCPDCSGDEMPRFYYESGKLKFTCPKESKVKDLPADWIRIWRYDGDRMASLIAEALECETLQPRCHNGIWDLGVMKDGVGNNRRPVLVTTQILSVGDAAVRKIMRNGALLFAALKDCELPADIEKRVFSFEEVVRFNHDGSIEILRDELALRYETVGRKRGKTPSEQAIAKYLFGIAKSMLSLPWGDRPKVKLTLKAIAKASGCSTGTASKILHVKELSKGCKIDSDNHAQIYFLICNNDVAFEKFKGIAGSMSRALDEKRDIRTVAKKFLAECKKLYAANKCGKNGIICAMNNRAKSALALALAIVGGAVAGTRCDASVREDLTPPPPKQRSASCGFLRASCADFSAKSTAAHFQCHEPRDRCRGGDVVLS